MNTTQIRYQRRHMADVAAGLRLSARSAEPRARAARGTRTPPAAASWRWSYATLLPTRRSTGDSLPRPARSVTARSNCRACPCSTSLS